MPLWAQLWSAAQAGSGGIGGGSVHDEVAGSQRQSRPSDQTPERAIVLQSGITRRRGWGRMSIRQA